MSEEYLAALNAAYNYFFFHYEAAPVLVVDTNDLDLESRPEQAADLFERIEEHTGGTVYYRPLGHGES
jgi:deoxyadenosine/deoxycytidine kinase